MSSFGNNVNSFGKVGGFDAQNQKAKSEDENKAALT
jgi:hypothetical protein